MQIRALSLSQPGNRSKMMTLLVLIALAHVASASLEFKTGPCFGESRCQCKWAEGKRTADCSNQRLTRIPNLTSDIQTLVLDNNPLRKLEEDGFKSVSLFNIQKLSLKSCLLHFVDENAFRDLKIMTSLDLSHNNLTSVFPKTFDGNNGLKTLDLSHNAIEKLGFYQFPPLKSLKDIDLSFNSIVQIDQSSFQNLGHTVESVKIHSNLLKSLRSDTFIPLVNLKTLSLHDNPWTCDCDLKSFRDWTIDKKLYSRPTKCSEPSRLNDKMWDDIQAADFACKPELIIPYPRVFGAPGVDATLACQIKGSPLPQARWVVNGHIVNNNTKPAPFASQMWILKEKRISLDGVTRWYNLTIANPSHESLGKYLCVAENNGGMMEEPVVLTFEDPATFSAGIPMTSEQLAILIGVTVAVVLIFLLVLLVCCCCFCKGHKKKSLKNNRMGNGAERNGFVNGSDSQKLLPNGHHGNLTNPHIRTGNDYHGQTADVINDHLAAGYIPAEKYHHHPHHAHLHQQQHPHPAHHLHYDGIEMQDMRAPSVISNAKQSTGSSSDGGRTASISRSSFGGEGEGAQYPDLLDHRYTQLVLPHSSSPSTSGSASTAPDHSRMAAMRELNPANLMLTPQQQHQMAAHIASASSSPFQRSGTLPLPQHHHGHHPRSVSCDHTNGNPLPHLYLHSLPVVHHHHHMANHHQQQARPGYVTLPRRPRQSWSVPRDTPSPQSVKFEREPIYDGIGPRTSLDGSSRLSLNKTGTLPNGVVRTPMASSTSFYAPIKEVQECPPTPKAQQYQMVPKSTPNILDLNGSSRPLKQYVAHPMSELAASSSEATLMEENISGYCEPFGKALQPKNENRNSITSAESELDLVVPKASGEEEDEDDTKANEAASQSSAAKARVATLNRSNNLNDKSSVADPLVNRGPKSSTPLRVNGVNGTHHYDTSLTHGDDSSLITSPPMSNSGKRSSGAPKTLPKPKVKPVPPPKPRKSFQGDNDTSMAPLISFQDEGADGSEV